MTCFHSSPYKVEFTFSLHDNIVFTICLIIFVALILKLLYTVSKSYFFTTKWFSNFMETFHANYIHLIRDHIAQLEAISDQIQNLDTKNEVGQRIYNKIYNDEYKKLERNIQQCVDQICAILNQLMGYLDIKDKDAICVCLKMVSIENRDSELSDRYVITVARSNNTSISRKRASASKAPIIENTDFLNLSKGFSNIFALTELRQKFENGTYSNSNPQFDYKSTIVVPVRYKNLEYEIQTVDSGWKSKKKETIGITFKDEPDILGFLCIDSRAVLPEWEDYKKNKHIINILSVYADSLYVYLSCFQKVFYKK